MDAKTRAVVRCDDEKASFLRCAPVTVSDVRGASTCASSGWYAARYCAARSVLIVGADAKKRSRRGLRHPCHVRGVRGAELGGSQLRCISYFLQLRMGAKGGGARAGVRHPCAVCGAEHQGARSVERCLYSLQLGMERARRPKGGWYGVRVRHSRAFAAFLRLGDVRRGEHLGTVCRRACSLGVVRCERCTKVVHIRVGAKSGEEYAQTSERSWRRNNVVGLRQGGRLGAGVGCAESPRA
jgi:hypothetical protein